jgi:hypothetical protein
METEPIIIMTEPRIHFLTPTAKQIILGDAQSSSIDKSSISLDALIAQWRRKREASSRTVLRASTHPPRIAASSSSSSLKQLLKQTRLTFPSPPTPAPVL